MNLKFLPDTEMGNLVRQKDWESTSLGPIHSWPENLHTALSIMMNSRFPMFLFWGPDLLSFYNDAYRPSFGNEGMHPGILGKPAQEAWADIWHIVKKYPEQVLNTGIATWQENQLIPIYRNGKTEDVYWTFSHSPVYNTSGIIEGIFVLCMETTQEVVSSKKIKESEERFRTMAENSSALIAVGDESSHAAYFNKAWIELTGRPMEDLLKLGWVDLVHPKDKDRFLNEYLSAFEKRETLTSELRMLNKDSRYSWLLLNAAPRYYADGQFAGYISSGVDITEQKLLQRKERKHSRQLNNLFAQAPAAIAVINGPQHTFTLANALYQKLFSKTEKELIGRTVQQVWPEIEGQGIYELLNKVYTSGEPFIAHEFPATYLEKGITKTGYYDFIAQPIKDKKEEITGILIHAVEVTDQIIARKNKRKRRKFSPAR